MKKVLVISGSPRKGGNSDLLCDEFIKGALKAGHQVEKIWLGDKTINFCRACYYCYEKHECFQKDDMGEILENMISSNVIVMATPVYFYSISGQMKTLIDRTLPRWQNFDDKEFYFIITSAEDDKSIQKRTLECLRGFTDCLNNPVEKGVLYATGVYKKGEVKNKTYMNKAFQMGLKA